MNELLEIVRAGDWDRFEDLVVKAGDPELIAWTRDPEARRVILDEVFQHKYGHVQSSKGEGTTGVVHWRVLNPEGQSDAFQLRLVDGLPTVGRALDAEPQVVIEIAPSDLLRVAAGETTSLGLMLDGRISVTGNRLLAAHLGYLFS
jgi:hypothetical protein